MKVSFSLTSHAHMHANMSGGLKGLNIVGPLRHMTGRRLNFIFTVLFLTFSYLTDNQPKNLHHTLVSPSQIIIKSSFYWEDTISFHPSTHAFSKLASDVFLALMLAYLSQYSATRACSSETNGSRYEYCLCWKYDCCAKFGKIVVN